MFYQKLLVDDYDIDVEADKYYNGDETIPF